MLTIRETKVFHGPSIWAPVPALVLQVEIGELEERLRRETPIFFDRLTALVPSLSEYGALVSQPDGGLRRLLLDRLALALQNVVGSSVTFAQTLPTNEHAVYTVVYQYQYQDVGLAAGVLGVRLLNHLLMTSEPDFNFARELSKMIIRPAKRQELSGYISRLLVNAAKRRGIPTQRLSLDSSLVQLGNGAYQRRISSSVTSDTGSLATKIASNKELTNQLLQEAGLPVPRNMMVRTVEEAIKAARHIGYPVVLKPLNGNRGRGVKVNLGNDAAVRDAFLFAAQETQSRRVIVEKHISGRDYRVLVIGNQIASVTERLLPSIIGDGKHTVNELIEITNADPRRVEGPNKALAAITIDEETNAMLTRQDLTIDDVPETGRIVQLKQKFSETNGGAFADRTDTIHLDNAEVWRQAASVVGLDVAGIDFITPDISRSVHEVGGGINEVNSQPGLRMQTYPTEGQPRDVAMAVINMLFPPGQPVRVPITAVTGTSGKTATSRMVAHILEMAGKNVGMSLSDGMYINGVRFVGEGKPVRVMAEMVLRNPAVEIAVFETAWAGILDAGLGFDSCDIAIVTNVSTNHLPVEDRENVRAPVDVTAVVPRAVSPDGVCVLNADDERCVKLSEMTDANVIYYSLDEQNPVVRNHVRARGRAVVLRHTPEGEMVTMLNGQEVTDLILVSELPTEEEWLVRDSMPYVLAAVAAAFAQDVLPSHIRAALRTLGSNASVIMGASG